MKKVALMALAAMALFSCNQDEMPTTLASNEEPVVIIKINVQGAASGRSIEDEHGGATGDKVLPKIFNGAIIPYNEHGVALSAITITKDQLKNALMGSYIDSDGKTQSGASGDGAKIGLPSGTKRVDVVLNRFTAAEKGITNINYFNMQDYKNLDGSPIDNKTTSNFERVPLVTKFQGVGADLVSKTTGVTKAAAKPEYVMDFTVSPNLARFEVFGAINVKKPETWTDGHGNHWYEITQDEFNALGSSITFKEDGSGSDFSLMQANAKNGFSHKNGAVYVPEYYWHMRTGAAGGPVAIVKDGPGKNVHTRAEIDDINNSFNVGWVLQDALFSVHLVDNKLVQWNPNVFYAVDVEEIFINNIKIRDANYDASMHNWPGSESPLWPDWYNAFHLYGWHQNGVSADNTFLCRANMWDRIAGSSTTESVTIPQIGEENGMLVLTGKAKALKDISSFADVDRNLGVINGKAAAYQIYAQSSTLEDKDANKDLLASALPHIILKIKAYRTAEDYKDGKKVPQKEFITIKLFKDDTTANARIRSFKAGSIYRLDMKDLLGSFVGEIPVPGGVSNKTPTDPVEPDPEMPGADLTVKVQIVPWTIVNMKPEI